MLRSLVGQVDAADTLVVDNGSTDRQVTRLCAEFGIEAVRLERNAGYSAAVNLAAVRATGDALVVLNDDAVVDPGFVDAIVHALDPGRSVVMAAGVLRDAGAPGVIDTAGIEIDRTLLADDYLNGEPVEILDRGPADPFGPSGAAAAYDRAEFLRVGGFDENLFAYWEDVDLALRLAAAGGTCRLISAARGTHEHSATLGAGSRRKDYLSGFGRAYVLRKWGVPTLRRLLPVVAREVVSVAGQSALDRNVAGLSGRIDGWRRAPRGRYPEELTPRMRGSGGSMLARKLRRRRREARSKAAAER